MGLRGSSQPGRRAVQPFRLNRGLHAHGWAAPQGQFSLLALGDASLKRHEMWPPKDSCLFLDLIHKGKDSFQACDEHFHSHHGHNKTHEPNHHVNSHLSQEFFDLFTKNKADIGHYTNNSKREDG